MGRAPQQAINLYKGALWIECEVGLAPEALEKIRAPTIGTPDDDDERNCNYDCILEHLDLLGIFVKQVSDQTPDYWWGRHADCDKDCNFRRERKIGNARCKRYGGNDNQEL